MRSRSALAALPARSGPRGQRSVRQRPASAEGRIADDRAKPAIELPDGPPTLECAQIGYQRSRVAHRRDGSRCAVTLPDEPAPVAEVRRRVRRSVTGKSEGAVVRRMDVLMTPGGGDVQFQLRALPGINALAEGAR